MPSVSKQQQKFMGMVHALQKGDIEPSSVSKDVRDTAKSMKKSDAKDFASTPHKGLPKKVKQEILNKLKEYANKMGRDHLGGDDYTSSKKGGLRDFDGYDNVDYNKDMPMDESTKEDIIKDLDKAKNDLLKKVDVLIAKKKKLYSNVDIESPMSADEKKLDKDIADLFSQLNKLVLQKRKLKEGPIPQNWMQGRTSDYHTTLRGKKKDYSGGTNFRKDNSGHPDLEDEEINEGCWKGYKEVGGKMKNGKMVPNCVPESVNEVGTNDWHFKAIKKLWDKAGDFTKKKIAALITKNPKATWDKIEKALRGSDYDDVTYYTDMLHLESIQESFNELEHLKLLNLAMKAMPGSPKQKEIIKKLNQVRIAGGMKPIKETSIIEYGQRLDLSYLEDDEAKLDGTPKPKDAINRNLDEGTMIRRASDIAQKLIPMDTWSRHASFKDGGQKNKEFVKNVVRDLAQSLNRFYKSHDINVRIQEGEGDNHNIDMVLGVLSILKQIKDKENQKQVALDMIRKFKEQDIEFDYQEFLDLLKEYSMGSYEYDK